RRAHFVGAAWYFEERIEAGGIDARWRKAQNGTERFAETGRAGKAVARIAVRKFALHVDDERGVRRRQQRRYDVATALSRARRADQELMFRSVISEDLAIQLA